MYANQVLSNTLLQTFIRLSQKWLHRLTLMQTRLWMHLLPKTIVAFMLKSFVKVPKFGAFCITAHYAVQFGCFARGVGCGLVCRRLSLTSTILPQSKQRWQHLQPRSQYTLHFTWGSHFAFLGPRCALFLALQNISVLLLSTNTFIFPITFANVQSAPQNSPASWISLCLYNAHWSRQQDCLEHFLWHIHLRPGVQTVSVFFFPGAYDMINWVPKHNWNTFCRIWNCWSCTGKCPILHRISAAQRIIKAPSPLQCVLVCVGNFTVASANKCLKVLCHLLKCTRTCLLAFWLPTQNLLTLAPTFLELNREQQRFWK